MARRRHVRMTRHAISPRLAIRTLSNIAAILTGRANAPAIGRRRFAGPLLECAEERGGRGRAERGGDRGDAALGPREPRKREPPPQRILDDAERRSLLVQPPMQRARRKVEATGDGLE